MPYYDKDGHEVTWYSRRHDTQWTPLPTDDAAKIDFAWYQFLNQGGRTLSIPIDKHSHVTFDHARPTMYVRSKGPFDIEHLLLRVTIHLD